MSYSIIIIIIWKIISLLIHIVIHIFKSTKIRWHNTKLIEKRIYSKDFKYVKYIRFHIFYNIITIEIDIMSY